MKLSTRARYGLRLCFLLGIQEGEVVSLASLVSQTNLSEKYLEQILTKLKKGGILESKRGASGGYILSRSPSETTLRDIFLALGNEIVITDCAIDKCYDDYCPNKKVMKKLYDSIDSVLSNTTLYDMIEEYRCDRACSSRLKEGKNKKKQ